MNTHEDRHRKPLRLREVMMGAFGLLLVACASIGTPDGGRYDEEPPYVVKSRPQDRATGVLTKKIRIDFNEYIKLENANEKIIISPAQLEPANVRAEGKQIRVDLYDSLKANTTYTIDFSDAVEDNNEGNPMGNYTFSFSTGDVIDTMEVSGHVLAAADLEPVKGILVGLIPCDSLWDDSLFRKTPLLRLGRTNGSGHFTIKGVKEGRYRCFALKDGDGNFCFSQKSEMIAFDTAVVVPTVWTENHADTIWRDSLHVDTVLYTPRPKYGPDNLILRAFLEEGQERHFLKSERPLPDWFRLYFTAPLDSRRDAQPDQRHRHLLDHRHRLHSHAGYGALRTDLYGERHFGRFLSEDRHFGTGAPQGVEQDPQGAAEEAGGLAEAPGEACEARQAA